MKKIPVIISYWKNNNTGAIYKYYGNSKPYNAENWTEVTRKEWVNQIGNI